MAILEYPAHEHALIQQEISETCRVACSMCEQEIHGTAYCCQEHCDFFLDESCASVEFPPRMHHPSHLEHDLIFTAGKPWSSYDCTECSLKLHVVLAVATLSTPEDEEREEEEDVIEHFSHAHPLTSFYVSIPNWFTCRGCWRRISGRAYGCHLCLYLLHESCAQAPRLMPQHPLHPQHPLTLVYDWDKGFHCQACDTERHGYLAYHCQECHFHLDMACATATASLPHRFHEGENEEDRLTVIQHFSHQHPLTSFYFKSIGSDICCKICELKISGEVYCCLDCIFFLHKSCADELPREIAHYLHPEHPLTFQGDCRYREGRFYCNCCSREYNSSMSMSFHCESCHFDVDPKCALQTQSALLEGVSTEIQHFSHNHPLTLFYNKAKNNQLYHCKACRQPITDGLGYSCRICHSFDFLFHQLCATLPLKLEHPFHPQHQLILLPRSPSAEYFYCSACHAKSQGFTFYCAECGFHLDLACASLTPTIKHHRHEHSLTYFQISPYKYPRCNFCKRSSRIDVYCCLPCNFNLHHKCLSLPTVIQHECHPRHPLVLFDRLVDGDPNDQYCHYCEEIRNPEHGVYGCDECWYTTHIDCVISKSEVDGNLLEQIEDPRLTKLNEEIASLADIIKVMEANQEKLTDNMEELKARKLKDFSNILFLVGKPPSSPSSPHFQFRPDQMESLQHPIHVHALIRRALSEKCSNTYCHLCWQDIHGTAYCCQENCNYSLHESCALVELPVQILNHPFHSHHPLGLIPFTASINKSCYSCGDCKYTMELQLALATLPPEDADKKENSQEEDIIHSHDHPLTPFRVKIPEWIWCGGCILKMSTQSSRVYVCSQCMIMLHTTCAQAPREMKHPFHSQHPLTLIFDHGKGFQCQACGINRANQLAYYCHQCRFHLDVPCASVFGTLPPQDLKNEDSLVIQHFSHQHMMISFHVKMEMGYISCPVCDLNISGDVYCCPDCILLIHKSCADKLSQEITHFLHPNHPLRLLEKPPYGTGQFGCSSCFSADTGINFNCEGCLFVLDPRCALRTLDAANDGVATEFQPAFHEHPMKLCAFSRNMRGVKCTACGQDMNGLAYHCPLCIEGFFLHKSCAQLPVEMEHPFHPQHPLKLLLKAPADYFYCNTCNVRSEGFTFCCINCQFYLDMGCASLKPTLKHPRHEHSLIYFQKSPITGRCGSCGKGSNLDSYCCLPCNFILHHDCLPLPHSVQHKSHTYHPLVLCDKFVDGDPNDQYCDYCETIRNPGHGVYRCEECWYTIHIDCATTELELDLNAEESGEDPELIKVNQNIASLEDTVTVLQRNLKASGEKLEALKIVRDRDFTKLCERE